MKLDNPNMITDTAYLSNRGRYIVFMWHDQMIRFMGPRSLQYINNIKEWDKGYLVIDAKYDHSDKLIEDYIDLIPILENLYINPSEFLAPIKNVEVRYA